MSINYSLRFFKTSISPSWVTTGLWALFAVVISVYLCWQKMGLSFLRFDVPIRYAGDAIQYAYVYQATLEDGWNSIISRTGMPFGTSHFDFPTADGFNFLIIRLLAFWNDEFGWLYNTYFLSTFVLCGLISFAVGKRLGLTAPWAATGSVLFNLLPFHFYRLGHLFYSMYFVGALATWLAVEVVYREGDLKKYSKLFVLCIIVAAILCGTCGVYYAFFSCLLIGVAGLCAAAKAFSVKPLYKTSLVIGLIVAATGVNLVPSITYKVTHGANSAVAKRFAHESEIYGLKITQMLLPVDGHRIEKLSSLRANYDRDSPLVNENRTASIGIIAAIGLMILLILPFSGRVLNYLPEKVIRASAPTYAGLLYATIGGFGTLFAWTITPQLRALNRISPLLAFFCIFTVLVIFQALINYFIRRKIINSCIQIFCALLITMIGIYDQMGTIINPGLQDSYKKETLQFDADRSFFRGIESMEAPGSMILQLPYTFYPEAPPHAAAGSYDLLVAYLHTRSLRWTFGAMKGRPEDLWQHVLSLFPVHEQIKLLPQLGFAGIYVSRRSYDDHGAAIESALIESGLKREILSTDQTKTYFSFHNTATPDQVALAIAPDQGWSVPEANEKARWMWGLGHATLRIGNISSYKHTCNANLVLNTLAPRTVIAKIDNTEVGKYQLIPGSETKVSIPVSLGNKNFQTVILETDVAATSPGNGDPRQISFGLILNEMPICL